MINSKAGRNPAAVLALLGAAMIDGPGVTGRTPWKSQVPREPVDRGHDPVAPRRQGARETDRRRRQSAKRATRARGRRG